MFDAPQWPFLLAALPFCLYASWSDLKSMRIPNWVSIALLGVWLVLALIFLPLISIGWHLLAALCIFVIGFFLNATGNMGGGDVKLATAITPFIALDTASVAMIVYAFAAVIALAIHRVARATPAIVNATPHWKSWTERGVFPLGTSISATLIIYLSIMSFAGKPTLIQIISPLLN